MFLDSLCLSLGFIPAETHAHDPTAVETMSNTDTTPAPSERPGKWQYSLTKNDQLHVYNIVQVASCNCSFDRFTMTFSMKIVALKSVLPYTKASVCLKQTWKLRRNKMYSDCLNRVASIITPQNPTVHRWFHGFWQQSFSASCWLLYIYADQT